MPIRLWLVAIALSASALGSCSSQPLWSSDEAPPSMPPPAPPGMTLERACGDLQAAACADFQRCSPETFGSAYPDLATCISVRSDDCSARRSALGNTVSPEQVEACAVATGHPSCEVVIANEHRTNLLRDPACVWQGTLLDGEACITSSQCSSGTCAYYARDSCGTCVTRADTDCVTSNECLLGSFCISGLCVVSSMAGQACGSLVPCGVGLTCKAGTCAPLAHAGEACATSNTGGCAPDLWCNRQTGLCEHSTLASASDGVCGQLESGSNVLCPAGEQCLPDAHGGTNHCVRAGAEGAPCSYQLDCGVGLDCSESTCTKLTVGSCDPTGTSPSPTYPAFLPSVPQGISPLKATLLTTPKVVLVTFEGDSRASALEAFVTALGGSEYWRSVTSEYGIGPLTALPPIRVDEMPAATLADSSVRTWLSDKLANDARFPATDGRTLYVVAYPHGVGISTTGSDAGGVESCRDFGGYHDAFLAADGTATPYAVIPDCFYVDPEAAISHEAVEAATDPFANLTLANFATGRGFATVDTPHFAWSLAAEGAAELADLCEWQPFASYVDPEVGGTVQRSWSNAAMAAFHQPCVPARAGHVYFNSVPHFDDTVTVVSPIGTMRTRGIAIPLGQSKTVPVDLLSDGPTDGPWRVSAYDLKEWSNEFDYTTRAEPTLRFAFDQKSGVNGDTLHMTITVLQQDSDYQAEPFVLVSRRGRDTNLWLGVVGQR